jgi:hypothetical protein
MADWKRSLFISIGWGLGTVVGLALLVGGFLWYSHRPKPEKPWNQSAIKAECTVLGVCPHRISIA